MFDVCIVGAGLSGACAANLLGRLGGGGMSVAILDARDRVGGRLLTAEGGGGGGGDLGGAWMWPRSERVMERFVNDEVRMKTMPMHLDGTTMIRTHDGRRHVLPSGDAASRYAACGSGAFRICGGADGMVRRLLRKDDEDVDGVNSNLTIRLGTRVVRVEYDDDDDGVSLTCVESSSGGGETNDRLLGEERKPTVIRCRAAILAAPPKYLANSIEFHPKLPKIKFDCMLATPTWMEGYGKVVVSFPVNWWRARRMSAISIDQIGAVSTWWEACSGVVGDDDHDHDDDDGSHPALAGFVTARGAEVLQKIDDVESLHDYIVDSLTNLYGVDATAMGMRKDDTTAVATKTSGGSADGDGVAIRRGGITVTYKSWLNDRDTNTPSCTEVDFACDYGDRNLQRSVGPLFFAGTETSHGNGHMEGAIISAQRAADEVIRYLG